MKTNYRKSDGCWNCLFSIRGHEVDWPEIFCNADKTLPDTFKKDFFTLSDEDCGALGDWEVDHMVEVNGVCDEYKIKGEIDDYRIN